jgi:5-methylcytosine-specific restriction protein B
MNSTDKSIALVDIALRRRFHFERLNVDYKLIKNQIARKLLQELNRVICAIKNPDYEIGHYYFMNIPEQDLDNIELQKVFETRILPLLEEYFFNDWEALATILGKESIKVDKKKKLVWDEDTGKFEDESGDTDFIYGLSIRDVSIVFENTMKNFGIYQQETNLSE